MKIKKHQENCPVLDSEEAQNHYRFLSITLQQEGCPFCEMKETEVPEAEALAKIKELING